MDGVEVFNKVVEHFGDISDIWDRALNSVTDWKVSEIPDERYIEIGGATITWSEKFDILFSNGKVSTSFKYIKLSKIRCSKSLMQPVKFFSGAIEVAYLYPSTIDWIDNIYSIEFFVDNLSTIIKSDSISSNVHLDDVIIDQPYLCFSTQYEQDAVYNALKLGYATSLTLCQDWYNDPIQQTNTAILQHATQHELLDLFNIAMRTENPYHQYVEFYHLIEYKYYEGLYQKLTQLKATSTKAFYDEIKKAKGQYSEEQMFEYVLEEIASGFSEVIDIAGIRSSSHYPMNNGTPSPITNLEIKFMKKYKNGLEPTNRKTWCDFLYQLRCGIVHTKEGEEVFERTSSNEKMLCDYILPFMVKLAIYLIEH